MIVISPVVLFAGAGNPPCQAAGAGPLPAGSGAWIATAYGPPWDAMNGSGVTATGLNLTAGEPAYEIAVDPAVIPLRELRARHPEPVRHPHTRSTPATPAARSSAATSTSTTGRAAPPRTRGASGTSPSPRRRTPAPGTCSARSPRPRPSRARRGACCAGCTTRAGRFRSRPEQQAKILPSGLAAAPSDAPRAVKLAIAAGNQLIAKPYIYGGGHGQPLTELAAGYDCSGVDQLRAPRRRRVRRLRRGLDRARELRAGRPRRSGSPSTPTAPTRSSTLPGSCSTPPGTRRSSRPPRAAGHAGSPPRSSPPNTPATRPPATAGSSNDTRQGSDAPDRTSASPPPSSSR